MTKKYRSWSEEEKEKLLHEMREQVALVQKTIKKIESGQNINTVLEWFQKQLFSNMSPIEQALHVAEKNPNARASIVMAVEE